MCASTIRVHIHVCYLTVQGYQKVPETPLASCSVLKEDQEIWMDVQVHVHVHCHGGARQASDPWTAAILS